MPDHPTARALAEQTVARLHGRMGFEGYVFAITDPYTKVAVAPVADVPMLPWSRLPELIRWRYLTVVNRFDRLLGAPAASLLETTEDPSESLVWQHVQRDLGVVDTAVVAFGDRYGAWGYLELLRTTGPFVREELDQLSRLAPATATGLREALARTFVDPGEQLAPPGPAVVVLGPDLHVRTQTDAAAAALLQLLPPGEAMAPIPAAAYNVGAALIAEEEGIPIGEPWGRVHLGGNRWMTVKASRLGDDIAVSIEPSTPAERTDLLGRAFGLSPREQEVLALLVRGLDSRAIAHQLVVAVTTAEDHVKALLAKTGSRTRQVLASRALGAA